MDKVDFLDRIDENKLLRFMRSLWKMILLLVILSSLNLPVWLVFGIMGIYGLMLVAAWVLAIIKGYTKLIFVGIMYIVCYGFNVWIDSILATSGVSIFDAFHYLNHGS